MQFFCHASRLLFQFPSPPAIALAFSLAGRSTRAKQQGAAKATGTSATTTTGKPIDKAHYKHFERVLCDDEHSGVSPLSFGLSLFT